jgi:hypothetical protein
MRALILVAAALLVATTAADAQTPTRIEPNSVVFVEASDFGQALQASMLKKKVPLLGDDEPRKGVPLP